MATADEETVPGRPSRRTAKLGEERSKVSRGSGRRERSPAARFRFGGVAAGSRLGAEVARRPPGAVGEGITVRGRDVRFWAS